MFKVIVAGSRHFTDYTFIKSVLNHYLSNQTDVEIVSGCAQGVDKLGERYAKENELPVKLFPADWNTYGRAAGPIRNKQMAEYADALILFWNGSSPGSKNMLKNAKEMNLKIHEIKFTE